MAIYIYIYIYIYIFKAMYIYEILEPMRRRDATASGRRAVECARRVRWPRPWPLGLALAFGPIGPRHLSFTHVTMNVFPYIYIYRAHSTIQS